MQSSDFLVLGGFSFPLPLNRATGMVFGRTSKEAPEAAFPGCGIRRVWERTPCSFRHPAPRVGGLPACHPPGRRAALLTARPWLLTQNEFLGAPCAGEVGGLPSRASVPRSNQNTTLLLPSCLTCGGGECHSSSHECGGPPTFESPPGAPRCTSLVLCSCSAHTGIPSDLAPPAFPHRGSKRQIMIAVKR